MRHQVFGKKLNRDVKERKALFKSLIIALISFGRIHTSIAKAKAVQRLAEKMVTKAKEGTDVAIRQVSAFLTKKDVINKLISEISPRFRNINGGYLRVRRTGKRAGDASEQVILEWTVAEEKKTEVKSEIKEKKKVAIGSLKAKQSKEDKK